MILFSEDESYMTNFESHQLTPYPHYTTHKKENSKSKKRIKAAEKLES
jgi:hypothetical protein